MALSISICVLFFRMKPATWYISMLLVAFLYIYLTCVQYIRGEEITIPQTARQSLHGKSTAFFLCTPHCFNLNNFPVSKVKPKPSSFWASKDSEIIFQLFSVTMPEREITDGKTKTVGWKCSGAFALSLFSHVFTLIWHKRLYVNGIHIQMYMYNIHGSVFKMLYGKVTM